MTTPTTRTLLPASALLLLLACGGADRVTGDRAGTLNQVMTVSPAVASLSVGQSLQFTASIPWGGTATWSVVPATGGTFTSGGLFTAAAAPGSYRIVAMWNGDVRYTALAQATILPPPPPAVSRPDIAAASGSQQGSASGQVQNAAVVGEPVVAARSADGSATAKVRHGYDPSGQ
ncbi:MAG: hypothetical protein HGB30_14025 [Holophagaceae bacterium]|nr:hypothetical protein [Holophagaceae bacterium]